MFVMLVSFLLWVVVVVEVVVGGEEAKDDCVVLAVGLKYGWLASKREPNEAALFAFFVMAVPRQGVDQRSSLYGRTFWHWSRKTIRWVICLAEHSAREIAHAVSVTLKVSSDPKHLVVAWLVQWPAVHINIVREGLDGWTCSAC